MSNYSFTDYHSISAQELKRKFILCSCHVTITHLKKYIESCLTNLSYKDLDIICDDEILGKDHTLKFILVTKWKDKVSHVAF